MEALVPTRICGYFLCTWAKWQFYPLYLHPFIYIFFFGKLESYSVWLPDWYKQFARVWKQVRCKFACLTAANLLNCVGGKHSFVMLAFCWSILMTIVKINWWGFLKKFVCCFFQWNTLVFWPLVLGRRVENLSSFEQLWWPWGRAFDLENCFVFKFLAFAWPPPSPD